VIDNSVVVSWLYPAQAAPYTEALLERVGGGALHAAFIWPAEYANTAAVMVRRGLLSEAQGEDMLGLAARLNLSIDAVPPDPMALYRLARQHALSAYDAAYLELALRLKLPLATRDSALERAARAHDLFLV
jgi:predicted nucleic acid-binding protein